MNGRKLIAPVVLCLLSPLLFAQPPSEKLQFRVEWRLIQAGTAKVSFSGPAGHPSQVDVQLFSSGLVSKLFKVNDIYHSNLSEGFCASNTRIDAEEGRRHRVTEIKYDRTAKRASYAEKDVLKNAVVVNKEIDTPACVHEVMGAMLKIRTMKLEPGQSIQMPISDGKKSVMAKVEAQEREEITTPIGKFKAMRYEAYLFNNVLYQRSGRLFVWITEDAKRMPVQIRVRLPIAIGTINLLLEKEEH